MRRLGSTHCMPVLDTGFRGTDMVVRKKGAFKGSFLFKGEVSKGLGLFVRSKNYNFLQFIFT